MTASAPFIGFNKKTVEFWQGLAKNNNKQWFEDHRQIYEQEVLEPARSFVVALGQALRKLSPGLQADPRINRSLFRINRDVRFSRDKSPYKTHMGLWLWEGSGKRMECSGYYFHLEPPELMMGAGIYLFPPHLLNVYRDAVADGRLGAALGRTAQKLSQKGYSLGGEHYKRVPRGFDPKHPRAGLLKHKGLFARTQAQIPPEFYSAKLVDWCLKRYQDMAPLHRWLLALTEAAGQ